jgi:hypothetical protein
MKPRRTAGKGLNTQSLAKLSGTASNRSHSPAAYQIAENENQHDKRWTNLAVVVVKRILGTARVQCEDFSGYWLLAIRILERVDFVDLSSHQGENGENHQG